MIAPRDECPNAPRDRLQAIADRLRSNGIYVVEIRPGRWPDPAVTLEWISFGAGADRPSPNDLLDQAREAARTQIDWVHAIFDDYKAAMAITERLPRRYQGPLPRRHPRRPTHGRLIPASQRDIFAELVEQMPISSRLITQSGRQPVVEFPESWLDLL